MKNVHFKSIRKLSKKEALEFWKKRDAKWAKYYAENDNYYETEQGDILKLGDRLPLIESTMYYDDEFEAPECAFKNFEKYNMELQDQEFELLKAEFFVRGNKQVTALRPIADHVYCVSILTIEGVRKDFTKKDILLSQEEIDLLNVEIEKNKEEYKKRLKIYWKKYQDKIFTCGYWANR